MAFQTRRSLILRLYFDQLSRTSGVLEKYACSSHCFTMYATRVFLKNESTECVEAGCLYMDEMLWQNRANVTEGIKWPAVDIFPAWLIDGVWWVINRPRWPVVAMRDLPSSWEDHLLSCHKIKGFRGRWNDADKHSSQLHVHAGSMLEYNFPRNRAPATEMNYCSV